MRKQAEVARACKAVDKIAAGQAPEVVRACQRFAVGQRFAAGRRLAGWHWQANCRIERRTGRLRGFLCRNEGRT